MVKFRSAAFCALGMASVSCGDYEMSDDVGRPDASRKTATEIPLDEALSALDRFYESAGATTRGGYRSIARIDRISAADMFPAATRSDEIPEAGDMLYVVNFSNDDGYAILGADSRLDTVLIVGDTGNFALPLFGSPTSQLPVLPWRDSIPNHNPFPDPLNPGRDHDIRIMPGLTSDDLYCEEEDEYYIGAIGNICPVDDLVIDLLIDYTQRHTIGVGGKVEYSGSHGGGGAANIEPLLKTKWGQQYPFNFHVQYYSTDGGKCPIGCTTTAASQILVYLKNINLENKFNITKSSWVDFENFIDLDCLLPTVLEQDLAKFSLCVADGIGVHYNFLGKDGTFAMPVNVQRYLQRLGYNVQRKIGFNRNRQNQIVASLKNSRPVFIGALDAKTYKNGGHAWVIDGCKYHPESNNYFNHCNFGWNGKSNGWYYYKLFDSSDEGVELDDPALINKNFNHYSWWFRILIIQ